MLILRKPPLLAGLATLLLWPSLGAYAISFTTGTVDGASQPALVEKCLGDIDGDGKLDVIIGAENSTNFAYSGIYWYKYPAWGKSTVVSSGQAYEDCFVADMDGDGSNDIVASYAGTVAWFKNPGNGGVGTWVKATIGSSGGENTMRYADIDGDVQPDVITEDKIWFHYGGNWIEYTYSSSFRGVALLDIGSGPINLVGTDTASPYQVVWYENPRETGATPEQVRAGAAWIKHTVGAGYPCTSGNCINSTGATCTCTCPQTSVSNYAACDLDGDGRMDIVSVQAEGDFCIPVGGMKWFKAPLDRRTGTWTATTIDSSFVSAHNVVCADMDNDGDNDLVSAEQDQARRVNEAATSSPVGRASVFINGGTGTFTRQDLVTTSGHQIQVADIDQDGDLDILNARHGFWSTTTIPIQWFKNATVTSGDTTPPVISSVAIVPGQTVGTATWTTNEASTSRIDYGTTTAYGSFVSDGTLVTSHSIIAIGALCNTLYHYKVTSADAAGNSSSSADGTFTTTACPAGGSVYYVNNSGSPACSDANSGTLASAPLCTVTAAYSNSAAGSTINITPGSYTVAATLTLAKANQTWQRSNTSGYAVLNAGGTNGFPLKVRAGGITLDGLGITGQAPNYEGHYNYPAIHVEWTANGTTIRNCDINVTEGTSNLCSNNHDQYCTTSANCTGGGTCQPFPGCLSCMSGIYLQGSKFLIENNTISGGYSFGIEPNSSWGLWNYCDGGSNDRGSCTSSANCGGRPCVIGPLADTNPPDSGGTIRNNVFTFDGDTGSGNWKSQIGILLETIGMWNKTGMTYLVYNNKFLASTRHGARNWSMFSREIAAHLRVWNNYSYNVGTCFYLQQSNSTCLSQNRSCATEDAVYFNNTCDGGLTTYSGADTVFWSNCINSNFKNNIFKNQYMGMNFRSLGSSCTSAVPGDTTGGGPSDSPRGGQIYNNLYYRLSNPSGHTFFSYYLSTDGDHDFDPASPPNATLGQYSQNRLNLNPNLTAYASTSSPGGLLTSGSPAIGFGNNNPLGQGAGVCCVYDGSHNNLTCNGSPATADCSLDAKGVDRGTTWDIGWDQFNPGAPTSSQQMLMRGVSTSGVSH